MEVFLKTHQIIFLYEPRSVNDFMHVWIVIKFLHIWSHILVDTRKWIDSSVVFMLANPKEEKLYGQLPLVLIDNADFRIWYDK